MQGARPRSEASRFLSGFLEEKHEIDRQMVSSVGNELASELGPLQASVGLPSHRTVQLEPLKPTASLQVESMDTNWMREIQDLRDDVMPRILRIEQKMYQHDKAINRALDIAVKHLPAFKS